jgi:hypothetical protein
VGLISDQSEIGPHSHDSHIARLCGKGFVTSPLDADPSMQYITAIQFLRLPIEQDSLRWDRMERDPV